MKLWISYFLILVVCASCAISPQQQEEARAVLTHLLQNGHITQAQFDALMAAMGGGAWWEYPLLIGGSILGSILGINSKIPLIGRGARTQVRGLPASLVKPPEQHG